MNTHRKGIIAYLLIAFGLAWTVWEIVFRNGISMQSPLFKVFAFPSAFAPAIACFVVRKWITREGFADAGLRLNPQNWRYYVVAWLLPLVVVGCIVVLTPLVGLGKADFSLARGLAYLHPAGTPANVHATIWLRLGTLPFIALLGAPILFGEEFGWRGYLQLRLFPDRPIPSAVVTGLIWAAWHFPVNLRGYNFPDHPFIGALVLFPIGAIFLSIIFGWLVLKTGSIWSSSLAHSATNSLGPLTLLLFGGVPSLVFISYVGILGLIPLGALSAWIVFTGQLNAAASPQTQNELSNAAQTG
jgi:membrane protease YdiL (CAAX protease family)